jgi:hypothetical protein
MLIFCVYLCYERADYAENTLMEYITSNSVQIINITNIDF